MNHLDVAGGTGDVAFRVFNEVTKSDGTRDYGLRLLESSTVTVCDLTKSMLDVGRQRAVKQGIGTCRRVFIVRR
jgi:2-methoxy-6-polyprenyl-1,4-benzoquinol methylase